MLLLYSDLAGLLQLAFQFRVLSQLRKCGLVVLKLCKPEANSPHVRCRPSVIQNWLVVWNRFRISSRICHLQQLNYLRNDSQFLWQWAPVLIKGTTTWAPSLHSFPVPLLSSLCHSLPYFTVTCPPLFVPSLTFPTHHIYTLNITLNPLSMILDDQKNALSPRGSNMGVTGQQHYGKSTISSP